MTKEVSSALLLVAQAVFVHESNLKGQALAGHITLCKGERSELAEIAAKLL